MKKLAISAFLFWAEEGLGALQVMQHIVPDSCLVLFCLTAWTLSLHFEKLHEGITEFHFIGTRFFKFEFVPSLNGFLPTWIAARW